MALVVLALLRLVTILPLHRGEASDFRAAAERKKNEDATTRSPVSTLIVLGSGGHTAEMLRLVGSLDPDRYQPRLYVWAATDAHSQDKMQKFEASFGGVGQTRTAVIPRSREVGQSYFSSLFTTAFALLHAVGIVLRSSPQLILCNGPGTCIPICASAYILKFFGRKVKIVYVESIARVETLSLSGKLLYRTADHFLVQWPQLQAKYPHAQFLGRLC